MEQKRSKRDAGRDAPITGVAAGSLGTAANLDDTQVFSTVELQAPAAESEADGAPEKADAAREAAPPPGPDPAPPREPVLEAIPTAAYSVGATSPKASASTPQPAPVVRAPRRGSDSRPALAGVAALVVLILIAGAGILSTLDLGAAGGPAFGTEPSNAGPTAPAETPAPKGKEDRGGGHGHGGCHGRGCNGGGED